MHFILNQFQFLFFLTLIYLGLCSQGIINITLSSTKKMQKYALKTRFVGQCSSLPNVNKKLLSVQNCKVVFHKNVEEIKGYSYVPATFQVTKGILTPGLWEDGAFKVIFNKTTSSPCKDVILSIPLILIYRADINCVIKKGNYSLQGMYPNQLAHLALGDKFFIGRSQILLKYYSKKAITHCFEAIADIVAI